MSIVIIDSGVGNLESIRNMLKKAGYKALVSNHPEEIEQASKIILPGVGHFDAGMNNLKRHDLIPVLDKKARIEKVPVLGICLGMQLMAAGSEEGKEAGLAWIPGKVVRFQFEDKARKIPHMGWSSVKLEKDSPLTNGLGEDPRFYFVHSYFFSCENAGDVLMTTEYGYRFTSAIQHENLMAVQFHPEKSHHFGLKLLSNFAALL